MTASIPRSCLLGVHADGDQQQGMRGAIDLLDGFDLENISYYVLHKCTEHEIVRVEENFYR